MATRNQKILGTLIGGITGGLIGNEIAKRKNVEQKDYWKYILGGVSIGAGSGFGLAVILGSPNDTVNYQLKQKKKVVYHGIVYDERFDARIQEHIVSGKIFTNCTRDIKKPRVEALELEKDLIVKNKPLYNIHHNPLAKKSIKKRA